MIQKELKKPIRLAQLEALIKRLPANYPRLPEIQEDLNKRLSGYRGEQSLLYYLSFLQNKNYHIFHNLRLPDTSNKHFFEIDTLLLSPSFNLIVDTKNLRGELYLDEQFEQLIQTYDNTKKVYSCPIAQSTHHVLQLRRLLHHHKFQTAPIESLIIFTNTSASISSSPKHKQIHKVIRSTRFLTRVEEFEEKHQKELHEQKQIQKLSKFLLKQHTPSEDDILKQYGISYDELIKGVCCPNCSKLPMKRRGKKWHCSFCGFSSKSAHAEALNDYRLLVGSSITNQKLRDFFCLPSRKAALNILKSLNLPHNGGNRNREYYLKKEF